jgi:addiction module HigA family antidote
MDQWDNEMTAPMVKRPIGRFLSHPGELMRDVLTELLKLLVAVAARRMQVSRPSLYAVLAGEGVVTADMALRFAKLTGAEPELHLRMQVALDLRQGAGRRQHAAYRLS